MLPRTSWCARLCLYTSVCFADHFLKTELLCHLCLSSFPSVLNPPALQLSVPLGKRRGNLISNPLSLFFFFFFFLWNSSAIHKVCVCSHVCPNHWETEIWKMSTSSSKAAPAAQVNPWLISSLMNLKRPPGALVSCLGPLQRCEWWLNRRDWTQVQLLYLKQKNRSQPPKPENIFFS